MDTACRLQPRCRRDTGTFHDRMQQEGIACRLLPKSRRSTETFHGPLRWGGTVSRCGPTRRPHIGTCRPRVYCLADTVCQPQPKCHPRTVACRDQVNLRSREARECAGTLHRPEPLCRLRTCTSRRQFGARAGCTSTRFRSGQQTLPEPRH